jgi:plastocyanin
VISRTSAVGAALCAATLVARPARAGDVDGRIVLPVNFQPVAEPSKAFWRVENGIVGVLAALRDPRASMVVLLEGTDAKVEPPAASPTMVLRDGGLFPAVLPVVTGTTVEFRNEDHRTHSLHAVGAERASFEPQPTAPGAQRSQRFRSLGAQEIRCAEVPHVRATVLVLSSRLFSKVDDAGAFKIAGVPTGRYSLRVWYAGSYVHGQPIDVPAEGSVTVEVALLPR